MKLDEFISTPAFSKYADMIGDIREDFINMGCEKFLWTNSREAKSAMLYTERLLKERHFTINYYIDKFIAQFSGIDFSKKVAFIYPEDYQKNYFIAKELSKKAEQNYVIQNIFEEDDTINWIAVFDMKDMDEINEMFYVIYNGYRGDNYGGYKLFGRGVMYYNDALEYGGRMLQASWPLKYAHFQGNITRRDTDPFFLLESRKAVKMLVRQGYFSDELEIHWNFQNYLLPFLDKMYTDVLDIIDNSNSKHYKEEINIIYSRLVDQGIINGKWINEQSLFRMIKSMYNDALYQYRPDWLEPQSLDVYIPSVKIGIEYQGVQHYKKVDFFGGEDAYLHRVELDNRKRNLCKDNGVCLLYWPYTELVERGRVKEVLKTYLNQ